MGKILLVEDDPNLSKLYKKMLEAEGYEVLTARDKDEGLRLALSDGIGLVLLDYMLAANTSGMDLLEELRKDIRGESVNVVMLTNVVKDEERVKAIDLGVKDYLAKAKLSPENVIEVVRRYVD